MIFPLSTPDTVDWATGRACGLQNIWVLVCVVETIWLRPRPQDQIDVSRKTKTFQEMRNDSHKFPRE